MGPKRPVVSVEDQALFYAAIEGARPLAERDRVPPAPVKSAVRASALPPEVKLVVEGDGQRYAARAPGVSRAEIAQLRAGKVHVEETLDLHGETVDKGRAKLREFLAAAAGLRRCVLIVHGKGTHSEHGAPLREAVLGELLGPLSGYVHALAVDAGTGATYVQLRGLR
jgi:DNA-nicking Smr family endonuclease